MFWWSDSGESKTAGMPLSKHLRDSHIPVLRGRPRKKRKAEPKPPVGERAGLRCPHVRAQVI